MAHPNTFIPQLRSHKAVVMLVSIAIAVVAALALVLLAMYWPFTRQAVIKSLQDASSSTVEIAHFHGTYFPFPGCVAEEVTFRRSSDPNTPPLMTVGKLTIQGSYPGLVTRRVSQIRAENLHIIINIAASGTAQKSPSPSGTTIDEIVASCNGDMRGALKALLLVNEQLEAELRQLHAVVAYGGLSGSGSNVLH